MVEETFCGFMGVCFMDPSSTRKWSSMHEAKEFGDLA